MDRLESFHKPPVVIRVRPPWAPSEAARGDHRHFFVIERISPGNGPIPRGSTPPARARLLALPLGGRSELSRLTSSNPCARARRELLAESYLTHRLFNQIVGRIERLTRHPT